MVARVKPGVPAKSKAVKPYKPSPGLEDPQYRGLVHRGPKPSPTHPSLNFRGEPPSNYGEWPTGGKKGKSHRSDTGGTVKVLKGSLDPSKHDASRLKYFGKKGG